MRGGDVLLAALAVYLRLFAPYLPFAAEEVWSWWQDGSVHRAPWPRPDELAALLGQDDERGAEALAFAVAALGAIRKKKSEEQRPLRTPVARLLVRAPADRLPLLDAVEGDLVAAGAIERIDREDAETFEAVVELGAAAPAGGGHAE